MNELFNLIDSAWIQTRNLAGEYEMVSIRELFSRASELSSLAGETPAQNFAILRILEALLVTVVYRYDLQGNYKPVKDEKTIFNRWSAIWKAGKIPTEMMAPYFQKHESEFNLLGEKRFMQSKHAKQASFYSCKKLIGDLAVSGHKDRLFKMRSWEGTPSISLAEAASWIPNLLLFDDTAVKKTIPYKAYSKVTKVDHPTGVGWGGKISPVYVAGSTLFETLMLNCVVLQDGITVWDSMQPYWEIQEQQEETESARLERRLIPAPTNLAALLTLPSRRIWLDEKEGRIEGFRTFAGDVFDSENAFCEQFTLWKPVSKSKDTPPSFRPASFTLESDRWHDLKTSFISNCKGEPAHLPGVIQWINRLQDEGLLPKGFKIQILAPFVLYGTSNSSLTDISSCSLTIYSKLLESQNAEWRENILAEIEKNAQLAEAAGRFAMSCSYAAGADPAQANNEKKRLAAQLNRLLNQPFLDWLSQVQPGDEDSLFDESLEEWEKTARAIGTELIRQEMQKYPPSSYFGRLVKNEKSKSSFQSVVHAEKRYFAEMAKIYPKPETE